jgi:hypothetical protein
MSKPTEYTIDIIAPFGDYKGTRLLTITYYDDVVTSIKFRERDGSMGSLVISSFQTDPCENCENCEGCADCVPGEPY